MCVCVCVCVCAFQPYRPTQKPSHTWCLLCSQGTEAASSGMRHASRPCTRQRIGAFTQAGWRQTCSPWHQNFEAQAGVKFNMTPNGELQRNGPVRSWPRVKILTPRHLCENPIVASHTGLYPGQRVLPCILSETDSPTLAVGVASHHTRPASQVSGRSDGRAAKCTTGKW